MPKPHTLSLSFHHTDNKSRSAAAHPKLPVRRRCEQGPDGGDLGPVESANNDCVPVSKLSRKQASRPTPATDRQQCRCHQGANDDHGRGRDKEPLRTAGVKGQSRHVMNEAGYRRLNGLSLVQRCQTRLDHPTK